MTDRIRDAFVAGLLAALMLAIPELSVREGRVAAGLAVALLVSLLPLARRGARPETAQRLLFLAAVLFLAVQPFAIDAARAVPIPARALWILGVVLALWTHMNVQSVSGKLAWRFSKLDTSVLAACAAVVFASLSLMWYRSDATDMVPQILLQGLAVACGVLYLYLTRWRPDRWTFGAAAAVLVGLLAAGFAAAEARGRRLSEEHQALEEIWAERAPEPGEVDALVAATVRARPEIVPDVLAGAGRAALRRGRPLAAQTWIDRALAEGPDRPLPWIAVAELHRANGDEAARRQALAAAAARLAGDGELPQGLFVLPATTARDLAVELLDDGRPAAALTWLDSADDGARDDLRLLRAEALLSLGRTSEALRGFGDLLRDRPADVETLLGMVRARLAGGDVEGAWLAVRRARAAGAPLALVAPLTAALGPADDPTAEDDRQALAEGLVVVSRDEWFDHHPSGNFLYVSREDRRLPLLLAPGRTYEITIEARGEPARRKFPRLRVDASGERIADVTVGADWQPYRMRLTPGRAATTLRLSFPNDYSAPGGEDRNLVVGEVRLFSWPAP